MLLGFFYGENPSGISDVLLFTFVAQHKSRLFSSLHSLEPDGILGGKTHETVGSPF